MKPTHVATVVLTAILVTGCTSPSVPSDSTNATQDGILEGQKVNPLIYDEPGPDGEFSKFADQVPGFGGMYINSDGVPVIFVKNPGRDERLLAELQPLVHLLASGRERSAGTKRVQKQPENYILKKAEYDYRTLTTAKFRIRGLYGRSNITGLDIREDLNRIDVFVSSPADIENARVTLEKEGIPKRMVEVLVREKQAPTRTLRDKANPNYPIVGGLHYTNVSTGMGCSIGVNVRIPASFSDPEMFGFLSAAHCTGTIGTNDGATFQQPLNYGLPTNLGFEKIDPSTFSCSQSARCRYSDVAFMQFYGGVITQAQSLAAPYYVNTTSPYNLTIYESSFYVVQSEGTGSGNYLYNTIYKIGAASGMQSGSITRACADGMMDGVYFLCQTETNVHNIEGDSGGPVFTLAADGSVVFLGITSARAGILPQLIYHSWPNIQQDFNRVGYTPAIR